jgi:hypothetical protein
MNEMELIERDTARYRETEAAHEEAREALTESVLAGLRAGKPPTAVAAASPFSEVYVRKLARKHGIPDYPLSRFPKARGELQALLPDWADAARAIGDLDVGLGDAEYVGGVLWTGLTDKGAKGNPADQKRVIVDRLTRWSTRDGGDASAVAAAIHAILDDYIPGR